MQFSNGLTDPVGLWLGHLMFDTIAVVVLSTIIIIIFATASNQFHGLGFLVSLQFLDPGRSHTERIPVVHPRPLWHHCCPFLLLYFPDGCISVGSLCHCRGISIRYIYCKHCSVPSIGGWLSSIQLYIASYLFVLTYGKVSESARLITIIHFATSFIAPVASVVSLFLFLSDFGLTL